MPTPLGAGFNPGVTINPYSSWEYFADYAPIWWQANELQFNRYSTYVGQFNWETDDFPAIQIDGREIRRYAFSEGLGALFATVNAGVSEFFTNSLPSSSGGYLQRAFKRVNGDTYYSAPSPWLWLEDYAPQVEYPPLPPSEPQPLDFSHGLLGD